jgi:hypothetical protein
LTVIVSALKASSFGSRERCPVTTASSPMRATRPFYDRNGEELVSKGLHLDVPPWNYHVFEVTAL